MSFLFTRSALLPTNAPFVPDINMQSVSGYSIWIIQVQNDQYPLHSLDLGPAMLVDIVYQPRLTNLHIEIYFNVSRIRVM